MKSNVNKPSGNPTNKLPSSSMGSVGRANSTANFLISIQHTENHSWQGSIQWLDTGERIHFRSELEMMSLMDQAVKRQKHIETREWPETLAAAK